MPTPPRPRSKGLQALFDEHIGDDPKRIASYERARASAEVAQAIYDLRTAAGLSQRELAELVGTTASVICRLEDADYDGHSLKMLQRVATALDYHIQIVFKRAHVFCPVRVLRRPHGFNPVRVRRFKGVPLKFAGRATMKRPSAASRLASKKKLSRNS